MQGYHIWTTGCQMNKADSERLESALEQMGLVSVDSRNDADVIVMNTCVVRQSAEDKAIGMLTSLKPLKERHPDRVLALMGCMVGPNANKLKDKFPYVDVFMRPQQYDPLINLLKERLEMDSDGCIGPLIARPSVSTYIPIIHGCNKFCSFCIIPYRRGREISRPVDEIVLEAEMLAARGVKEVTLLGQNVDSYGHDLPGAFNLGHLLEAVNNVRGIKRIRFLTSHPNDMGDDIIEAVASLDKVCEHINLPFQAGDDHILRKMRRGYTNEEYRRLVSKIRRIVPDVTVSTDLIVGFSGETDEQFHRSLEMLQDIRFDKVHAAAYSVRKGTISARMMEDNLVPQVKQKRLRIVNELQEEILTEINAELVGRTFEILVEGEKGGKWFGRTRSDKLVFFKDTGTQIGDISKVRIDKATAWSLQGEIV